MDLLDTPPELQCPITHEVFRDPVINSTGQIYEREAIEQCLQQSDVDPITRQRLPVQTLTPVWMIKSRAMEYRESTARACLEVACSSGCHAPILFLRRAAELAGDDISIPGLSPECVSYVQQHTSNVYDSLCLHKLAESLKQAGLVDKAVSIFYHLLQHDVDRAQQAELLRRCLECWTSSLQGEPDGSLCQKLAAFMQEQHAFSWGTIIDVVQGTGMGLAFTLKLCEEVLLRGKAAAATADSGDPVLQDMQQQKELLLKYVQVSCQDLQQQLQTTRQQVLSLEQQLSSSAKQRDEAAQANRQQNTARRKHKPSTRRPRLHLHVGVLARAALVVLAVVPQGNTVIRGLSVVPTLWLTRHT